MLFCCVALLLVPCARAADREITILHTSDLHGYLMPWHYGKRIPMDVGLVAVGAVVESEREADPDLLLFDGGDTIQGTPLMYYYNVHRPTEPSPMAVVMNAMRYNAMTIGNHEYNFGQPVLDRFIREARFPVLSANIRNADGSAKYRDSAVFTVKGVRVGVLGLTTPGIMAWEKPQYIKGLRFDDVIQTARRVTAELRRQGATVIVGLCHSGMSKIPSYKELKPSDWMTEHRTWQKKGDEAHEEQNFVIALAEAVDGIDVILAGHSHTKVPQTVINGVLILQPWYWGMGVSKAVLTVGADGAVKAKKGEFLRVSRRRQSPVIRKIVEPFHRQALDFVGSEIGATTRAFEGGMQARFRDSALVDFINGVQLDMAEKAGHPAQISLASVFNDGSRLPAGALKVSDVFAVYPYENTLTVMEITGDLLRRALEHTAAYWKQHASSTPPQNLRRLVVDGARDYNWDMYVGLEYEIDISKPVGERVVKLFFEGQPVRPEQKLILAVNNHRAGGGGGYDMFKEGRMLWESSQQVRDYMIDYVRDRSPLDPDAYHVDNWRLRPF